MRPIDANALKTKAHITRTRALDNLTIETANVCVDDIDNAPTLSLNTLRDAIYQDAVEHGLWEEHDNIWWPQECHSLIENEVDELYESLDVWANSTDDNNERFVEELADVVIMCFSVAGKLGIDIDAAIRRKMEINKGRAWKHGKE